MENKNMKFDLNIEISKVLQKMIDQEFETFKDYSRKMNDGKRGYVARDYHRCGYYTRILDSKFGTFKLKIPKLRNPKVKFSPPLFKDDNNSPFVINKLVCDLYSSGLSNNDISKLLLDNFNIKVSSSKSSEVTKKLQDKYDLFINKKLNTLKVFALYIDSTYFKVKHNGVYETRAYHTVIALDKCGLKQIIYAGPSDGENIKSFSEIFTNLKARGLKKPTVIVIDGNKALKKAIQIYFPHTDIARCLFHVIAEIGTHLHNNFLKKQFRKLCNDFFNFDISFAEFRKKLFETFPNHHWYIENILKDKEIYTYLKYNEQCFKYIMTNNAVESVNQKFKIIHAKHKAYGSDDGLNRALIQKIEDINDSYQLPDVDVNLRKIKSYIPKLVAMNTIHKYKITIATGLRTQKVYYAESSLIDKVEEVLS